MRLLVALALLVVGSVLGLKPTNNKITFISSNEMKIKEVKAILGDQSTSFPYALECQSFELAEPQATPVEISRSKCEEAAKLVGGPVIVDDTSLHFNALGGMPGPYIKHFYLAMGNSALSKMLDSFADRSAYAQCVVSFSAGPGEEVRTFCGIAEGTIIDSAKFSDSGGFGWDPLFIPTGFEVPFGQMPMEQKNRLSHRFKALRELKAFINSRSE